MAGEGGRRRGRPEGPVRTALPHARPGPNEAVARELRHHLEEKIDRLVEQGMDPESARVEAERAFGDMERVQAEVKAVDRNGAPIRWLAGAVEGAARDLRLAVRSPFREPWLASAVTLTLGLGIGSTVAMFSVVEAVFLRPLPFDEPERIVYLYEQTREGRPFALSPANFIDWRDGLSSFETMSAVADATVLVTEGGDADRVPGAQVSADYFRVLGVQPFLGRTFSADEDVPDGPRVAVVSYDFWSTRLGGDPDAVGRTIRINGEQHTVIGVMPQGIRAFARGYSPDPVQVWRPYPFARDALTERSVRRLGAIGRLRSGVTFEQADTELKALASALAERYPDANDGMSAVMFTLPEALRSEATGPVLMLFGAVGFILLIACLNVGSLLFARADTRRMTITLRRALGATRAAVVWQLLAESLVLSLLGTALGVAVAWVLLPFLVANSPIDISRVGTVEINGTVLVFAGLVTLVTAVATSLAPALSTSSPDLVDELKQGGRGRTDGRRARAASSSLVVAEVALSATLVVGAGLLLGSYVRLSSLELGFEPDGVIRVGTLLPTARYAAPIGRGGRPETENFTIWQPRPEEVAFVEGVEARLAGLRGVESVAAGNFDPMPGMLWAFQARPEGTAPDRENDPYAALRAVNPDWFRTLRVPILRGRPLDESDRNGSEDVVVLDVTAADQVFPGRDPIGERIMIQDGVEDVERPFRVVGVSGKSRQSIFRNGGGVLEEDLPVAYVPYRGQAEAYVDWQIGFRMRSVFLVRTDRALSDIGPEIRETISSFDSELVVTVVPLAETVANPLADRRFYMSMLVAFAFVTLVLVASGVFAVMAYSVTRKTRELGIRLALGARAAELKRAELVRGMRLALLGIVLGGAGAAWLSRFIESFLYGVTALDPAVYTAVAIIILAVVLAAAYVPARRAALADPMTSLRAE